MKTAMSGTSPPKAPPVMQIVLVHGCASGEPMQQVPKLLFLRGPGHRNLSVNVDLPPLKQSSLKSTKVLRWSLSPKVPSRVSQGFHALDRS